MTWANKADDEVVDYQIEWTVSSVDGSKGRAFGDVITASAWDVPDGITKNSDTFDATAGTTTIWLSGGTLGETYSFTNHIITAGGRHYDQTEKLKIRAR